MSCLSDFRCNTVDISNFRAGFCEGGTCRGISRWLHLKYKSLGRDKWMQCRCTLCSSLFVSRILNFFFVFLIFVKILPSDCEICLKNWNVVMLQWGHNFFFLFITYHSFLVIVTRLNFFFKNLLCFSGSYKCKLENKRLCHVLMI